MTLQGHHPLCSAVRPTKCPDCGGKHCDCATIGRVVDALTHDILREGERAVRHSGPDWAWTHTVLNVVLSCLHPDEPVHGLYERLAAKPPVQSTT